MGVPNENDCFDSVKCDVIDRKYGFQRISDNVSRTGYLINMHSIEFLYDDGRLVSALDLFFIKMDGTRFKYTVPYLPYFLVCVEENCFSEITQYFKSKFGSEIANIEKVYKEDLDLPNHLSGLQQPYLKVIFHNQNTLNKVKKIIISATKKYASKTIDDQTLITCSGFPDMVLEGRTKHIEPMDGIIDIREHDLPYHIRVSIDLKIFCGMWYDIKITDNNKAIPIIYPRPDILERPEPIVLAFDIETTKLPLKFPDLQTDQIMMISYVVDGQGYLITNREIISADVYNFEYTPKPEFEGHFIVFNECNEMSVIQKFFSHIIRIRPHIFVTYNGDFFDWPFIEARAAIYGINMNDEIGFSKSREGTFLCRPAIHMDCLCWVKRDSYLPVGSHGLKAVAKAKLRYDPIELDPEEMCKMAVSQPQILSNYSVSDAIATFYLYIKYVHPFIFALNTIIPMEPDEVLRKGSGTLCETLLMVEAYHANIVFPNKQQNAKSKFSNQGNLLDSETYVGGHVEALECGVFRADIPYRFRLDRNMISQLIQSIEIVLEYAIVTEEGVPIEKVTNFQQISREIKQALQGLYDIPNRLEQPVIYHLDVGAMYPNIILTNRLQPSAVVTDADCAACDYNYPDAKCKRTMKWHWRGDVLPASKNELLRIRQQLKTEKFPPIELGGSQRAFHELSQEDQVAYEKKRVLDYCRNVYKKNKLVKLEERNTTICQKENSFYVDTVRAFRDRRYEYKELTKTSKKKVADAVKKGDAAEIKSAKNEEILYDSLQLAHKCILNSFYGYVMRKGARWHSMPMAGIVCLTGSNIITKARHIVERIGRPLELDTDGIWCILPASFPQVFTLHSTHGKKSTFNISYPNAVLNNMVKDHFTNNQYHELIKNCTKSLPEYRVRTENSIFFEVDGPYLAMVLPAAKEEGKKLKKRYAVFNFDGSMAELKGFEVKRRGELQLIKNFQSSVFESFLYGSTLQECYAHVAKIANYWLDVLYSHGQNLPDNELFELISENRSMSKKLEEYGTQKSTSISTAKRLAELLGDQMVKDAGLSCKYVISKKPDGSPVTERAIPLVIFQCEPSIKRHYLRRWLKDSSIGDVNIRDVLDWSYYIERLNGAVQKIITIPAAIQGLSNPVSRVSHPDWLLKRMIEKNDKLKQRQINDMFGTIIQNNKSNFTINNKPTKYKILKKEDTKNSSLCAKRKSSTVECIENYTWKKLLGAPPDIGNTRHEILVWISFQKKKWNIQLDRKQENKQNFKKVRYGNLICTKSFTVSEFLKQSKKALSNKFWQIVHLKAIDEYGTFTIWALVEDGLHKIKLKMPRIFYINQKLKAVNTKILNKKSVNFTLPRSAQAQDIFKCIFQERTFKHNGLRMIGNVSVDDIEGVYETKISLDSRFLIEIGCLCKVNTLAAKNTLPTNNTHSNIYSYEQLEKHADTNIYLEKHWTKLKIIFLYQHSFGIKQIWGLFFPSTKRSIVIVLDKVRVNHMSTMQSIYIIERTAYLNKTKTTKDGVENIPENMCFEVFLEVDLGQVYRHIQRSLCQYKENKRGPTLLCTQSLINIDDLKHDIPMFSDFPNIKIHISDDESAFEGINWQNQAARLMIRHFLNLKNILDLMLIQCRYLNIPIGNVPSDPVLVGTDIFYARLLQKNNFVLWWSTTHYPDLGGREVDDFKEFTAVNSNQNVSQNKPGFYSGVCVGLTVQNLAISALLQSSKIREMGGVHSAIALRAQTGAAQSKHEVASCNSVLRILRTMINGWLHEVSLHKNVFSDYHITQFNRWLESKSAFMYDPVITNTLNILMKKLFLGIIKELKRMGVDIIFADLSRIIINSKKNKLLEALDYVEFIVQSIRSRELYHSIKLSYDKSWDNLLWLDASNFAGVNCSVSSDNTQSQEKSFDISFSLCLDINQNQEINNQFEELVVFLIRSFTNKTSIKEAILNNTDKIFSVITDLQNKYHAENPATVSKIVHIIVKIINLSNDLDKDIISLRRNLFKVVDINEFSKTIEFFPRVDLILTGITCKVCNDFRNIDLVNDPQTMRKNVGVWLCPRCLVAFDNLEIERLLGENVTNRITSFSLQDLKCSKCSNIKQENLSKNCGCGGNYMELLNKTEIVGNLSILLKIAKLHQMRTLYHTLIKVLNTY